MFNLSTFGHLSTRFIPRLPPMISYLQAGRRQKRWVSRRHQAHPLDSLINMKSLTEKPRPIKTPDSSSKKRLDMHSPKHKTPDQKSVKSPMDGKLSGISTRSQSKSGTQKRNTVTNSTFATTPTENRSLLQASFMNRTPVVSPLARPPSDTDPELSDKSADIGSSNLVTSRPKKSKCPCMVTSGGTSWLLTCSHCGQVWHSACANLKGGERMDQSVIDAILVTWECPWCYTCPFPCPKTHKSAKLSSTMDALSSANLVSASVMESLEGMLKVRFAEVTQPTNNLIENIQKQLSSLSDQMNALQERAPPLNLPPPNMIIDPSPRGSAQLPSPPRVDVGDTTLTNKEKSIEGLIENYLTDIEEKELMNFLEKENFTQEGNRSTIQYGQHYRYMGSKTNPKPIPDVIKGLLTRLNTEFASSNPNKQFHYELNSCLVNRFAHGNEVIPEHSDNEGDINKLSSIFTISLGSPRTVHFRDIGSNEVTEIKCHGRSMYHMTRASQEFFKHSIKEETAGDVGVRYSLTFRSIHWSNFNSTVLVGDSNFGPIHFGAGRGKMGQATPGIRLWAATVDDVDPLSCVGFRNVVVMEGTNNLKSDKMDDDGVRELYKRYKTKLAQIRRYNPRCKLIVCPVLPTKSHKINRKINIFNQFLYNDLTQCNLKVLVVDGFMTFLDKGTNLLKNSLAKPDSSDILHINGRGVGALVKLIKNCIFTSRDFNRLAGSRLYSNACRGGPPDPV